MNQNVNDAIQALLDLHLTKGVQPSDLADNIFDNEYSNFFIEKKGKQLLLTCSFVEDMGNATQTVTMRYAYDQNRYLTRIDQKIGSKRFSTQWCRETKLKAALEQLSRALKSAGLSQRQISKVLSTLPPDIKSAFQSKLKLVA